MMILTTALLLMIVLLMLLLKTTMLMIWLMMLLMMPQSTTTSYRTASDRYGCPLCLLADVLYTPSESVSHSHVDRMTTMFLFWITWMVLLPGICQQFGLYDANMNE